MKTCTTCQEAKPLDQFPAKGSKCKSCHAKRRRQRPSQIALKKDRIKRAKDARLALLDKCVVCGEEEQCCLDLHHLDPDVKERKFSTIRTIGALEDELSKGAVVVCANCHRRLHAGVLLLLPWCPTAKIITPTPAEVR